MVALAGAPMSNVYTHIYSPASSALGLVILYIKIWFINTIGCTHLPRKSINQFCELVLEQLLYSVTLLLVVKYKVSQMKTWKVWHELEKHCIKHYMQKEKNVPLVHSSRPFYCYLEPGRFYISILFEPFTELLCPLNVNTVILEETTPINIHS